MQRHDWSSTSQKEPMLYLSLSPCTGYQLQLASSSRHWCLHIEQPQAQHPRTSTHYYKSTSPPEVWDLLVSDASWLVPSQRGSKSLSRTFSFTVPGWWNDLPTPIRNSGSLSIFKQQLKTHLFRHYSTSFIKKMSHRNTHLVLRAYPLSVCLFKMNLFMYSPIVSCFG